MFGKRGEMPISVAGGEMPLRAPGFVGAALKPAAARAIAIPEIVVAPRGAPVPAAAASAPGNGSNGSRDAAKPQAAINSRRSDNYYDIKSHDLQRADRCHRPDPARPARPRKRP